MSETALREHKQVERCTPVTEAGDVYRRDAEKHLRDKVSTRICMREEASASTSNIVSKRELSELLGSSRSGYLVRYTLTHSTRPFAAAVIADGYDDGYFYYLSRLPLGAVEAHEY